MAGDPYAKGSCATKSKGKKKEGRKRKRGTKDGTHCHETTPVRTPIARFQLVSRCPQLSRRASLSRTSYLNDDGIDDAISNEKETTLEFMDRKASILRFTNGDNVALRDLGRLFLPSTDSSALRNLLFEQTFQAFQFFEDF